MAAETLVGREVSKLTVNLAQQLIGIKVVMVYMLLRDANFIVEIVGEGT